MLALAVARSSQHTYTDCRRRGSREARGGSSAPDSAGCPRRSSRRPPRRRGCTLCYVMLCQAERYVFSFRSSHAQVQTRQVKWGRVQYSRCESEGRDGTGGESERTCRRAHLCRRPRRSTRDAAASPPPPPLRTVFTATTEEYTRQYIIYVHVIRRLQRNTKQLSLSVRAQKQSRALNGSTKRITVGANRVSKERHEW